MSAPRIHQHRPFGLRAMAVCLIAFAVAGCSAVTSPQSAATGASGRHPWTVPDTLRIGSGLVPRTLNPLLATQTVEAAIDRLFSSLLVCADEHGRYVPDLAAEVPTLANGGISADGLTIRYRLRHGVTWQDGQPFTSADVKFTFDAIMNPDNDIVSRHGYDVVRTVETPDPYTVVFRLKGRFAPFVGTVFGESDSPYQIVPRHLLAKYPNINDIPFNALPVGTGPYRVTRWLRGNQIELTRYEHYFRGRPKLKSIVIKLVPDENTEITLMRTHEIDWFLEASVNAYKALRDIPSSEVKLVLTPINGYEGVMMNNRRGATSDIRVRKAIGDALDKSALTSALTFGAGQAATEDLPPFLWAHDGAQQVAHADPDAARTLLAQAGYGPKHPLELELYYEQSAVLNKTLSVQIQSALAAVNIDVRVHPQLSSVIYGGYGANGTLARGHYDIAIYQWTAGIDPDDSAQFSCKNIPPGGYNQSYFCNAAMDAAQQDALSHYDEPTRKAAYSRIERILAAHEPIDFLWWPRYIQPINTDFHGFTPSPVTETWNAWQWSM